MEISPPGSDVDSALPLPAAEPIKRSRAPEEIVGLEYLPLLDEHLARLRAAYDHPNRLLHFDTVLVTLLIGCFSSADRSLRMFEDLSQADDLRSALPVERAARSTLSDALASMKAEHLLPIIKNLWARLPGLKFADPDLAGLLKAIVALDGSVFSIPADVLWAISTTRRGGQAGGQIRLNLQLDVLHFMPKHLSVSGKDDGSETKAFIKDLQEGVIYLADRNFVDFAFLRAALAKNNDLVVRLRKDTGFIVIKENTIDEESRSAGVISDRIGRLSDSFGDDRIFREVTLTDPRTNKPVRLLTTLLELPARVIALLYRYRWMIELFFKWLKCVARMRHLFSHSHNGVTIQFYVAVIHVLLTYLRTGQRPGIYEFNALGWVAAGIMSVQTMHQVLARRQREREQNRARRARKQAAAKPQA